MKLTDHQLLELKILAEKTARLAGSHVQNRVHDDLQVDMKEGQATLASSVLTEVDIESQAIIYEQLSPTLQSHDLGWLGEESEDDGSRLTLDYFWTVDPIDGTMAFTENTHGYSVCIALVSQSGKAILGVIYDPVKDELYSAFNDQGAYWNQQAIQILPEITSKIYQANHTTSLPSRSLTFLYDISQTQTEAFRSQWPLLKEYFLEYGYRAVDFKSQGGAGMKTMNMVRAHHHQESKDYLYYKPSKKSGGGSIWDFAASSIIFRELGFFAKSFSGEELWLNDPIDSYMNRQGILYSNQPLIANEFHSFIEKNPNWLNYI